MKKMILIVMATAWLSIIGFTKEIPKAHRSGVLAAPVIDNPISDLYLSPSFTTETVDLSNVFSDADGDPLIYSVSATSNLVSGTNPTPGISISLNGTILTLTNNRFSVSEIVQITVSASDGTQQVIDLFEISPIDIFLSSRTVNEELSIGSVVGSLSTLDPSASNTYTYSLTGADATSFQIGGNNNDELQTAAVFDFESRGSYSITVTTDDGNGNTFDKEFILSIKNTREVIINENFNSITNSQQPTGWSGDASVINGVVMLSNSARNIVTPEIDDLRRGSIRFKVQKLSGSNASIQLNIYTADDRRIADFSFNAFNAPRVVDFSFVRDDLSLPDEPLKLELNYTGFIVEVDDVVVEVPTPNAPVISNFEMFDIISSTYAGVSQSLLVDAQISNSVNEIVFGDDGFKMFILDESLNAVLEYDLSTAFNVSTASFAGNSKQFSIAAQNTTAKGLAFNDSGTKMYIMGDSDIINLVLEYDLTNAFDVSSAVYAGRAQDKTVIVTKSNGLAFNSNGTKMYVIGEVEVASGSFAPAVIEYDLSAAFDVSSTATGFKSFNLSAEISTATDIAFSQNGDKLFVYDGSTAPQKINQYYLSTAYDISTATYSGDDQRFLIPSDLESQARCFTFDDQGSRLFVLGSENETILTFDFVPNLMFDEASTNAIIDINANDGFGGANDELMSYTLSGADEALFFIDISSGALSFNTAPDFENPSDDGGDNIYDIILTTSNSFGVTNTPLKITVLDVLENQAPTVANPIANLSLTRGFGTRVINLQDVFSDPEGDAMTFTASSGDDSKISVSVSGTTLTLTEESGLGQVTITASAEDTNGGTTSDLFDVVISNNPPMVANGLPDLTLQKGFTTKTIDLSNVFSDKEGSVLTFTSRSTDGDKAEASVSGSILTLTEVSEAGGPFNIIVTAEDIDGATATDSFELIVNAAPTSISLNGMSISENQSIGTRIGFFTITDANDQTHTITLTGTDALQFTFVDTPNDPHIVSNAVFDFETKDSYNITITADDEKGGTLSQDFTIMIRNVNEVPVLVNPIQDLILSKGFTSTTLDFSNVFSDVDGDELSFSVFSEFEQDIVFASFTGNILTISESNDSGTVNFTVEASDGNLVGTVRDEFSVTVTDNNSVTVANPLTDITLQQGFGTETIDLTDVFTDADGDVLTYTARSTDGDKAEANISGTTLTLTEVSEVGGPFDIIVTAEDSNGGTAIDDFELIVNAPPTDIALNGTDISENQPVGTRIGFFIVTDANDQIHTITLSGTDASQFTFVDTPNDPHIISNTVFDFETKESYVITVNANDEKGGTLSQDFTISVSNVNELTIVTNPIVDITLTEGFVSTTVDLSSVFTDEDGDPLSFSVFSENTDIIDVSFSGNTLTIREGTTIGTANIIVTADDQKGGMVDDVFEVTVNENNEPIIVNPLPDITLDAGFRNIEIALGDVFEDADVNDMLTFSAISTNQSIVSTQVDGNTLTLIEGILSGNADISVSVSDGNGGTISDEFTVTVSEKVLSATRDLEIKVYPNPFSKYLNIKSGKVLSIQIFSLEGHLVYQKNNLLSNTPILLEDLSAGAYILSILNEEGITNQYKLIKE